MVQTIFKTQTFLTSHGKADTARQLGETLVASRFESFSADFESIPWIMNFSKIIAFLAQKLIHKDLSVKCDHLHVDNNMSLEMGLGIQEWTK